MAAKNYYEILGVSKSASEAEIKSAYRKLALKWHPDRWVSKSESEKKNAEERMKEINQAYEVLSNPEKRRNYDQYGSENIFNQGRAYADGFGRDTSFFKDIFDTFFGETDYTGQRSYTKDWARPRPGSDILITISLTFKESVLGTKKKVTLSLEKACASCSQSGAHSTSDVVECPTCYGRGVVNTIQRTILGSIRTQTTCSHCQGERKIIKKKCSYCRGEKFVTQKETIEFNIPRGIQPEKKLRYQGLGNDGWYGGSKGDIYVIIKVKENPYFRRKDNNIHVELPISFLDAILGSFIEVITLEGIEKIQIPSGTQNGDCVTLRNRGCYLGINKDSRGDLYIWLQVKLPKKITQQTEMILRNLQTETTWNPNKEFIKENKNIIDK